MHYWKNPKIDYRRGEDRNQALADGDPINQHWERISQENLLSLGPFPPILHYPGTYILYFLSDPDSKSLFKRVAQGEKMPICARCEFQAGGDPCCPAAALEFEWWDDGGSYIGPEEYDPETGWEEIPDCECKCQCFRLPIFQNRRAIGGPGTLDMFWENPSTRNLIAAVQYTASPEDQDLIITHMVVRDPYQRNRINSYMIDQLLQQYPDRELYFHDLTDQGRSFMQSYGGRDFDDRD